MIENARYCPVCDDNTVKLKNGPNGFFYACTNFRLNRCTFTQGVDVPPEQRKAYQAPDSDGEPAEYSRVSNVAQAQTRDALERSTAALDEFAAAHGLASCDQITQQLRERIPGYGTIRNPKDLTDDERAQRGLVLGEFMAEGIKHMIQKLPYDPADRSHR